MSQTHNAHWTIRIPAFAVSMLLNSMAIVLIAKAALGTTPISSFPFVVSTFFPWTFGEATFALNAGLWVLEFLLLRSKFEKREVLQLVAVAVFSAFIDVWMHVYSFITNLPFWGGLLLVLFGCALMAFGICIEVASRVILVPGEGAVAAISYVEQWKLGSVKIGFDVTLVVLSAILSNFLGGLGNFTGLGIGTVISAVLVGKCVNFYNLHFSFLNDLVKLSLTEEERSAQGK